MRSFVISPTKSIPGKPPDVHLHHSALLFYCWFTMNRMQLRFLIISFVCMKTELAKIENFVHGSWITASDEGQPLYNAVNGELIAFASSKGIDFKEVLDYARKTGNAALRKMTFPERGRMLRALALHLTEKKEKFYAISYKTGATR